MTCYVTSISRDETVELLSYYCSPNDAMIKKRIQMKILIIMKKLKILAFIISITILFWTSPLRAETNNKLKIVVSIVPQKYFVEKIGGDLVDVSVMVQGLNI